MTLFQTIVLAVVEGITEFLPISSTGHLILATDFLKIVPTDFVKTFEIAIQFGAITSVLFLYKDTLLRKLYLWKKIFVAFLPSVLIGWYFYGFIKNYLLGSTLVVTASLIVGGIIIIIFELNWPHSPKETNLVKIGYKSAFVIGLFQSVSVIPGVSRAAATIIGGLVSGLDRKTAVEFSFLLAVPTMFAATVLDLFKTAQVLSIDQVGLLLVGFFGAFLVATATIKLFIDFIKRNNFISFGIYRILVGILFLLK